MNTPDNLPPLPEGGVILGLGKSFNTTGEPLFEGWCYGVECEGWGDKGLWQGNDNKHYYAAPTGSPIAILNGHGPDSPKLPTDDLWDYFQQNHGLSLLESELSDIRHAVSEDQEQRIRDAHNEIQTITAANRAFAERIAELEAQVERWRPIETAPKDGTIIDLWQDGEFEGRQADCFWGMPMHECGEEGEYCDSDWHSAKPGWVDSTFQEFVHFKPTYWRPLPSTPPQEKEKEL